MRPVHGAVAALLLAVSAASAAATPIVKNGGFESPVVPAGNLDRFSTGQTIGKWTVVGASGTNDLISSTFNYEGVTFTAHAGKQWLDLTGASQTQTGVAQTVLTTAGTSYTLTFFVGTVYDPGGQLGVASTVEVLVNGTEVGTVQNASHAPDKKFVWKKFTMTIKATGPHTTIEFLNLDPSNDTANGLDEVSLTANP